MFIKPLKYSACLLGLVLGDTFKAKVKDMVSKKNSRGTIPRPPPILLVGLSLLQSYSFPHLPRLTRVSSRTTVK